MVNKFLFFCSQIIKKFDAKPPQVPGTDLDDFLHHDSRYRIREGIRQSSGCGCTFLVRQSPLHSATA